MITTIANHSPKTARIRGTKRTHKTRPTNTIFPETYVPERCIGVYDEDFGEDSVAWSQLKSW